jgi:hypothetical protein
LHDFAVTSKNGTVSKTLRAASLKQVVNERNYSVCRGKRFSRETKAAYSLNGQSNRLFNPGPQDLDLSHVGAIEVGHLPTKVYIGKHQATLQHEIARKHEVTVLAIDLIHERMDCLACISLFPLRARDRQEQIRVTERCAATVDADEDIEYPIKVLLHLGEVVDEGEFGDCSMKLNQARLRVFALSQAVLDDKVEDISRVFERQDVTDAEPEVISLLNKTVLSFEKPEIEESFLTQGWPGEIEVKPTSRVAACGVLSSMLATLGVCT